MKRFTVVLFAVLFAGLTGCSSVKMQDASLMAPPSDKKAIVNFVRQSVFFGDGVNVDVWDGATYVGSLGAGRIIQHEVEPGKHVFFSDMGNKSYVSGDLVGGKQYFLKVTLYPGALTSKAVLGVVKSDDQRVAEWLRKLTPAAIAEKDRKEVEAKNKAEIQKAVNEFESGKVTFATIQPEDAR